MTTTNEGDPQVAEHDFQITHYIRQPGSFAGWSQVASGMVNAVQAHAFIDERQAAAVALGLSDFVQADAAAQVEPDPTVTAAGGTPGADTTTAAPDAAQPAADLYPGV
jgi:hypothetical protein